MDFKIKTNHSIDSKTHGNNLPQRNRFSSTFLFTFINERNEAEEKKQILSENPTWKFEFYYATHQQFSSIKVGF